MPKTQIIYQPRGRALEYSLLAANLYAGCGHGCTYCYAPAATRTSRADFGKPKVRTYILTRLKRDAAILAGTDERVLLSFSTDPYQPLELEQHVTTGAIDILKLHDIPFNVLTKGGSRAVSDFHLYGPHDIFGTTLTFLDISRTLIWEPGAATPEDRIEAIQAAKEQGIFTWVSLEPVIDPQTTLRIIEETHDFVDHYKVGKLNYVPNDVEWDCFGVEAVNLLEKYDKSYYIKKDLAAYIYDVDFHNTDIRTVVRK